MTTVEGALAIETMQGGPLWIHSVGENDEPVGIDQGNMLWRRENKIVRLRILDASGKTKQSCLRLLNAWRAGQKMVNGQALYRAYFWSGKSYDMNFADYLQMLGGAI